MKNLLKIAILFIPIALTVTPAHAGDVAISAAASLKEVINELSDGFARTHPDARFVKNYGASGALAKQIENGVPCDIFISASTEWMDYLKAKRMVEGSTIGTFAFNTLVFAGSGDRDVSGLQDLAKLDRIAIGSPKSVPAGEYAVEALKKAGMAGKVAKSLVMARDVRECLMYAERGEVDGSFVYRTDALQAKRVKILFTVPQELYPRVTYPMALTVSGGRNREAVAFFAYLRSDAARAVLARYGFAVK